MTESGEARGGSWASAPRPARRATVRLAAAAAIALLVAAAVAALRAVAPTRDFSARALVGVMGVAAGTYAALSLLCAGLAGGPARRIAGRFALAVAAGAVVLAALELPAWCCRLDWRRLLARQDEAFFGRMKPWKNPWNLRDPELVYRRPPDTRVTGRALGDCVALLGVARATPYEYDVVYDSRGYRNAPTPASATVAVIGDSFVEAALVPGEELLTTRLERALGVPVANLGVGGYGPLQQAVVLRRDALPLAPRLVFWCFFEGNDLLDARRIARHADDERELAITFEERSFAANAARLLVRAFAPVRRVDSEEARRSSATFTAADADRGATVYFPFPARPLSQDDRSTLREVTALLERAAAECRERGAELVLVFVPEKFRVYRDLCDHPPDAYARDWQPSELPELLAAWARGAGVGFVDLTAALQRAAARDGLVYFADDGHWNGRGHAVAAGELERAARERGIGTAR